jgi:hypothetical protein
MKRKGYNSYKNLSFIYKFISGCFFIHDQEKSPRPPQAVFMHYKMKIMRKINYGFFNYNVPLEIVISRWCSFTFNFMFFVVLAKTATLCNGSPFKNFNLM